MTKHLTLLLFIGLAFWSCSKEVKKPEKVLSIDERIDVEQERLITWYTLLYGFDYKQDSSEVVQKAHYDMLKKLNNKHKEITGADSPTYLAYQSLYNFELSLSSSSEDAIEEERNFYLEKIKQKRMLIDSLKRVKP